MANEYDATRVAFDVFRSKYGLREPCFVRHATDSDPMTDKDGLEMMSDGSGSRSDALLAMAPLDKANMPAAPRLWVVREGDVVHAEKFCSFGDIREAGEVKHTNLTGGKAAHSGGEIIILADDTLVVSGDSGRYGPRDENEMLDVAVAFKHSGYTVYSMGFDHGANKPYPLFAGTHPALI